MAVTTWTDEDVETIVSRMAEEKLSRGEVVYDMAKWRAQARERVLRNESSWCGYIESTVRGMSTDQPEPENGQPKRVPPGEAMRRLYDAKVGELTRYGVREPDRTTMAVDYACSEVHRCMILPMPPGGVGQLEDELYAALGFDRTTGIRFTPRAS